ncbi:alpha/beta hydrolase family protein [Flavobacteriaceae bacterium LMO-SS05]
MIALKNIVINGNHQKPILIDVHFLKDTAPKPVVIFCHGYKGFKDWGAWDLMALEFAKAGFCFVKFNFSHNGGTVEQPIDFPDLEAFGNNNYSIELDDLKNVIDWVNQTPDLKAQVDLNHLNLIGHSRGGGIATIKAEEDHRIKTLITLAGVSDFKTRFNQASDEFKTWKHTGIKHVLNGRTHQQMPHYFQFYEDFIKNEKRFSIQRAASNLKIPHLIIHGSQDTSVSIEEAKALHGWNPKSKLVIVEGANHVFGTSHPWIKDPLPFEFKKAIDTTIEFIKTN